MTIAVIGKDSCKKKTMIFFVLSASYITFVGKKVVKIL